MTRTLKIGLTIAALGIIFALGAFLFVTRDIAAPSTDIQDAAAEIETSNAAAGETVFRIVQAESQVTYTTEEVLNGADKTVVGATDQVAGDILVNLSDPTQSEIGEITINARTFATDDTRRDNAVARMVLQSESDANEFITFQPTAISGLPDTLAAGESVTLQVTGDLNVAGQAREVTFDLTATLDSATRLSGSAEATIAYADFGLRIPNVPFVASVEDTVILQISFVADAVTA